MSGTDRATGAVTLALGAFVAILAASMPLLRRGVPGPGLLPLITGLALVVFGGILLLHPGNDTPFSLWPARKDGLRVVATVAILMAYTAAVPVVGFPTASALFLTCLVWWWGNYRWWISVAIGVLAALAMVLVFEVLLHAPLPEGIWG